jgi:hypothetical protein
MGLISGVDQRNWDNGTNWKLASTRGKSALARLRFRRINKLIGIGDERSSRNDRRELHETAFSQFRSSRKVERTSRLFGGNDDIVPNVP